MSEKKYIGHVACLITMIIWGLSFVSIDFCLKVFRPMTLAFIRFAIAAVIMFIVTRKSKKFEKIKKEDYTKMALSGIVGISIYFYFENNGILHTDPSIASLLLATIPLFSLVGDVIFFKEKMSIRKWMGIAASIVGVVLIIGLKGGSSVSLVGNLFMLGAVLAWVIYSVMSKPLTEKYSHITIVYYQTLFGAIALFPFTFMEKNNWEAVNGAVVANVLFLAILCSIIGYILYIFAVDSLGISISAFYINLMPLVTVIGSYFILGTVINVTTIIGGALVISSVFLISENQNSRETEEVIGIN